MTWCAQFDRDTFVKLPVGVRIQLAAWDLRRYGYGRTPVWPYPRPLLPSSYNAKGGERLTIDCSSATAYLAATCFPDGWDGEAYGDLQTFKDRLPNRWCSLEAWERCQGADLLEVGEEPTRAGWYAVQGWRSNGSGHAFFLCRDRQGHMVRLHSTSSHGLGPEYRADDWESLCRSYSAGVRAARLPR